MNTTVLSLFLNVLQLSYYLPLLHSAFVHHHQPMITITTKLAVIVNVIAVLKKAFVLCFLPWAMLSIVHRLDVIFNVADSFLLLYFFSYLALAVKLLATHPPPPGATDRTMGTV